MKTVFCFVGTLVLIVLFQTPAPAQLPDPSGEIAGQQSASQLPNTPMHPRPTKWGEPTKVGAAIYVLDVDTVDSANQSFSAGIYYAATWRDPSLAHAGPGPKVVPTSAVWTPRLGIVNQQQAWNALPSFVEVLPDGTVVLRQKTWGWFSQPFDLREFPLDRQKLTIHMVAAGLFESEVHMVPASGPHGRRSGIAETFSLPDFRVVDWMAEPRGYFPVKGEVGTAGFILELTVERIPNYYFWKLIVPLCLIVAMSWVPRWIDSKEVGTSIGIAATGFLTLVAYLFATAVLLPKVPYFTRIDQFILLSTLLVFFSLVQTVLHSYIAKHSTVARVERINYWSRPLYPISLLIVLTVSFAL
ncbi:hypothetical protein H0I76_05060 [Limibaculum sp. M0105]|uniref:Neurotransmitter-gated ion-channel ligand-binding domain-containing protein n=1 Tax=Thermohalobaculum xanthum TaxID=2753746 RepID=A0A8J7SC88_9RHOB|nr:hypothetical protein [Thermohalobaculum xanthum]MBK0398548.1 hypothetical protein [Thermohalobaculum xanthum]